jgi:excinuclease ABC subunit C
MIRIPDTIKRKLQELPDRPGCYLMRDARGRIIYVGKAASLRKRVQSYFRAATLRRADPKLRGLVRSVADLDILVVRNEAEALLTEGRLIKDYRPRYNVSFRDDKRFLMLRIDPRDPWPMFKAVRFRREDGAGYFGPYASSAATRAAMAFVEKTFGLRRCRPREPGPEDHRHCINDIVRTCSAPCVGRVTRADYGARVEQACAFLRGESPQHLEAVRAAMEAASAAQDFEQAAALRDTLLRLRAVVSQRARVAGTPAMKAGDARAGVADLQRALALAARPATIECYDISNISGTHAVASLVCAVEGLPQPARYRHFRIKTVSRIDDPAMMAEVVRRRFTRLLRERGALPDLLIVDGGITQLRAAQRELHLLGVTGVPIAGLAKRFEEIYVPGRTAPVRLPPGAPGLRVLQHIRDEAHRFALQYHRRLRARRIRESVLDEIEGIGGRRKQELLRHFGSVDRLRKASADEIAAVPGIGAQIAREIRERLGARA